MRAFNGHPHAQTWVAEEAGSAALRCISGIILCILLAGLHHSLPKGEEVAQSYSALQELLWSARISLAELVN